MPVAIITGDADVTGILSAECEKLGARVYFKPLGLEELLEVACSLLPSGTVAIRH
jgi:hypothetical protein